MNDVCSCARVSCVMASALRSSSSISLACVSALPDEATKASLAGLDYGLVRSQLLEYLEQQPFVQQLRAVPGLELATEVTQDYFIIMNIKIDMSRIDLQALSNVEGVGTDFTELATISPSAYILGLKLKGAVQVQ